MSKKGRDRYTQLSWGFGEWVERHADQLDTESVAVMAVLMGWSEANWSGVFLVNPLVLQRRTLLGSRAQVMAALAKLEAVGFLSYCEDTRLVWLKAMAERHCGGASDGKVMNAWPILGALGVKDAKFFAEFWERCRDPLGLDRSGLKPPASVAKQGGRVVPPPPSLPEGGPSPLPPPPGGSPADPTPSPLPGGDRLEVRGKREEARASHAHAHTHARENPSQAELAQGASAAWLEDTLEERAKTIMSSSIAEIPVGMEDHVSELKATAQAVASEYMRQCPGVVKSRNLLLGIARAVTALADDSELGCEGAKRQLFLMLEWFKRGNARRWQYPDTQSGKDWFGDAIEVFGGMAGMVSASGVPRDTANVVQANLTQAIAWKADEDARNAPVVHWREEDHPVPPPDPNEKRTLAEMYADFLAAKEREAAEKRAQQVAQ